MSEVTKNNPAHRTGRDIQMLVSRNLLLVERGFTTNLPSIVSELL